MLHIFCPNHKFSGRCFSLQYAVFPPFKVSFVTAWLSFIKKKNVSLLVSCLVLLPVFALLCLIVSLCSPVVFLPPLPSCVLSCDYPSLYLVLPSLLLHVRSSSFFLRFCPDILSRFPRGLFYESSSTDPGYV